MISRTSFYQALYGSAQQRTPYAIWIDVDGREQITPKTAIQHIRSLNGTVEEVSKCGKAASPEASG